MDGGFKNKVKTKEYYRGKIVERAVLLVGGGSSHMKNESIMEQCTCGGMISNDRGFKTMQVPKPLVCIDLTLSIGYKMLQGGGGLGSKSLAKGERFTGLDFLSWNMFNLGRGFPPCSLVLPAMRVAIQVRVLPGDLT